jgi:hypothetical protein
MCRNIKFHCIPVPQYLEDRERALLLNFEFRLPYLAGCAVVFPHKEVYLYTWLEC